MKPLALALIAALSLAACKPDAADSADSAESGGGEGGSSESGGGGLLSGLTGESCLHGTWAADAAQTFSEENFRRLMPLQEGGPQITLAETSGRALVTFAPDGEMTQRFEDFSVTFSSDVQEGMSMRMTMTMRGANDSRYTVTGNELAFLSDDGAGENTMHATMSIEMAGRTMPLQEMDSSLFEAHEGDGGAAVTYECSGDELLLDIAAEGEGQIFFNDARYTRVG